MKEKTGVEVVKDCEKQRLGGWMVTMTLVCKWPRMVT